MRINHIVNATSGKPYVNTVAGVYPTHRCRAVESYPISALQQRAERVGARSCPLTEMTRPRKGRRWS